MYDLHLYTYPRNPDDCHVDRAQKLRVIRNIDRAIALDEAMFRYKTQHHVLVLTLTYREEWKTWMTLDDLRRDRDTFLNNVPFNALLKRTNGYVWKIEEGHDGGGLHIHIVIYYEYSGISDMYNDVYYAEAIKNYWVNVVTSGRGYAWNSNEHKAQDAQGPFGDVTGMIDVNDVEKRSALRRYLAEYICKADQQVAARSPHCRMFGTSQLCD